MEFPTSILIPRGKTMKGRLVRFLPPRLFLLRHGLVLVMLGILAAACATRDASAQGGVVTGSVLDAETRQPVADVVVDLITSGRQRIGSATPEAQRRFKLTAAPAGSYSLALSPFAYE